MQTMLWDLLILMHRDFLGPEAAWANKKYHGHHTLPPDMATSLKKSYGEHMKKLGALS